MSSRNDYPGFISRRHYRCTLHFMERSYQVLIYYTWVESGKCRLTSCQRYYCCVRALTHDLGVKRQVFKPLCHVQVEDDYFCFILFSSNFVLKETNSAISSTKTKLIMHQCTCIYDLNIVRRLECALSVERGAENELFFHGRICVIDEMDIKLFFMIFQIV